MKFVKKSIKKNQNGGKKQIGGIKERKNRTIKRMNCSPAVKSNNIGVKGSCLPGKALLDIRDQYNADHPNTPIETADHVKLWHELKTRLTSCDSEYCWIKTIKNEQHSKQLENAFSPKQPDDWKKNPVEWLSNFDMMEVLEQYEHAYPNFRFFVPTSIDFDEKNGGDQCVSEELCNIDLRELVNSGKNKLGMIFNLSKSTEPGSHWVSLFVDYSRKSFPFIFYLDSGNTKYDRIPVEIMRLIGRIREQGASLGIKFQLRKNLVKHQKLNTECGMYSLFMIITMLTEETECQIAKTCSKKMEKRNEVKKRSVKELLHLFQKEPIPDKYVEKYRKIYFND